MKECKECCREISEEEYNSYNGYCKSCYKDSYNIENNKKRYNQSISNSINYEKQFFTNYVNTSNQKVFLIMKDLYNKISNTK